MQPGMFASQVPPGEDFLVREVAELRTRVQSMGSTLAGLGAIAAATVLLTSQQAALTAQQADISAQVAYLLTQSTSAEKWNIPNTAGVGYVDTSPATNTGEVWLAFDSAYDATLTATTSSTGKVSVTIAGNVGAESTSTAYAESFIGLEILQGGTPVHSPTSGDGPYVLMQGGFLRLTTAGCPYLSENYTPLSPNTTYEFRTRRGYQMTAGGGGDAYAEWTGATITVTKLGI